MDMINEYVTIRVNPASLQLLKLLGLLDDLIDIYFTQQSVLVALLIFNWVKKI